MKPVRILTLGCVVTAAAVVSSYADDRPPTAEERAKIEAVLKEAGFVSWKKIELDDGEKWEVDDARHSDGKTYELELSVDPLTITKRAPD